MIDTIRHAIIGSVIGFIMGLLISSMFFPSLTFFVAVGGIVVGAILGSLFMGRVDPQPREGTYPYPTPKK